MAYEIKAILAEKFTFRKAEIKFPIVYLPHDIEMLPLSEEVIKTLNIKRFLLSNYNEIHVDKQLDDFGLGISIKGKLSLFRLTYLVEMVIRPVLSGKIMKECVWR